MGRKSNKEKKVKKKYNKWTIKEENFVIKQFQQVPQPSNTAVKRAFRKEFYPKNAAILAKTRPADFRRIYDRFQNNGVRRPNLKSEVKKRIANPSTSRIVKDSFDKSPRKTIKDANQELQIPKSTVFTFQALTNFKIPLFHFLKLELLFRYFKLAVLRARSL